MPETPVLRLMRGQAYSGLLRYVCKDESLASWVPQLELENQNERTNVLPFPHQFFRGFRVFREQCVASVLKIYPFKSV